MNKPVLQTNHITRVSSSYRYDTCAKYNTNKAVLLLLAKMSRIRMRRSITKTPQHHPTFPFAYSETTSESCNMSTAIWDPNTLLQITDPAGRGMFCVGLARPHFNSQCGSRCRLDVPCARYMAILSMLDAISTKLPHDVPTASSVVLLDWDCASTMVTRRMRLWLNRRMSFAVSRISIGCIKNEGKQRFKT